MIVTINPATEEVLAEYPAMSQSDIEGVLDEAYRDFADWRRIAMHERSRFMLRAAALLRERKAEYGALVAREMGKPLAQAVAEIEKSAWVCDFYAANAEGYLKSEEIDMDGAKGMVVFEPLGLVLGVMPWNFPFWQVFRFAVPALMAGNGAIVKHAPNVTGCAIAIESVFRDAGFPENIYRTLHIALQDVDTLTGAVIAHPSVQAVSVTGSTAAGRAVATRAGRELKRSVMELGGNDPYIVLEDADLEKAVTACAAARLLNSGQSCIAAKRFIVHRSVRRRFEELLLVRMLGARTGDPFDPVTEVGPIARADLRMELHRQVSRSVTQGATLLCGGTLPEGKGYFYPPTILSDVIKGMAAYGEETFGPVATVIEAATDDEAVAIANDSEYGLGSAVFSADPARALAVASRLETGNCFINAMVKSDPRLPFGGVKHSGYGRELSSYGIREFTNIRSLYFG
ncbi:MAG: NAD-dependent succinate-semialdehyde dehydrogenase [Chlorobium sp.]|uniref:NAD-dependent succinate-semialdehyde dehydrogenase n=1 Tax=Chlorobium sp. TaxID=1095 RepID=UPI0025C715A3|nr:NAD-dependent succinate-semialdehyde dehydrogenase [Chlorobium sp.]MCF8382520.1 NAD-dependent succinate-semialdehyde dehydrogenase [Chlorobium sp.]